MSTSLQNRVQQLRSDADALDDIGPCAWDDADAKRAEAKELEASIPNYSAEPST